MHLLTLDLETFWSNDHSLSKMSPIEYAMHPETEIISCAAKVGGNKTDVVFGEDEVRRLLVDCGIKHSLAIAHNMPFDSTLVAWRMGLKPRMWGCTLSMARPHHGTTVGLGLGKLVAHYGIGVKDNSALINTKGKHLRDFTPEEIAHMRVYNRDDTDQCCELFKRLRPLTNNNEMWAIDSNIRMLIEDEFVLDMPLLREALRRERAKKHKTLMALAHRLGFDDEGIDSAEEAALLVKDELMSAPKFSALLRELGVEVPTKPSPSDPDKMIPALAKTDVEFQALVEHDNELVAAAAAARLEMKSTQLETRLQSFIATGEVRGGKLPIPTKYWGARTGRDTGELYNALNLPKIVRDRDDKVVPKLTNALRMSLRAPPGKVVMAADKSGIEMRINHTLWRVPYSTAMWQADPLADIYKATAAQYYGVDESEVQKAQRQYGKVLQLACGYGVGAAKFKDFARGFGLILTDAEAKAGVDGWRQLHPEIADWNHGGWARCQTALSYIEAGEEVNIDPAGLLKTCRQGIVLPDGNLIHYPDLRQMVDERTGRTQWKYGQGRHTTYLYGGKVDENICQALGRIILMDDVREFWRVTGLHAKLRVYDEAVFLPPEADAPDLLDELLRIMRTPPKWWPGLIVWAEGDVASSYGLAK